MNIGVIGTGYVGLVTGACFAEMGNSVICIDVDVEKIEKLRCGILPIYEPGLESIITSNVQQGRLKFSTSLEQCIDRCDVLFIAVGTPPKEDGSADLKYVLEVARTIGQNVNKYCVIVDKSTVPVGTADSVRLVIQEELHRRRSNLAFDVVSNPEFLKEGAAVKDFMSPDRIVIGCEQGRAKELMTELYSPFVRNHPRLVFMGVRDAEMTKYAANAMLATKISFMNEIAAICEKVSVDIESVRIGIGSDQRIGFHFIYAGAGYGGSCFPKDVKALIEVSNKMGVDAPLLKAVENRNFLQKRLLFKKICAHFGTEKLNDKRIAIWGLAFKPETDDMREAPSKILIDSLIEAGARVTAFDPVAMDAARQEFDPKYFRNGTLVFSDTQYEAAKNADALVLITEWKPFRHPDLKALKNLLKGNVIFDGRNQYEPSIVKDAGFQYYGIGRE